MGFMSSIGSIGGVAGGALGGLTGLTALPFMNKVDEKNPYQVNESAFQDPNLAYNLYTYHTGAVDAKNQQAPQIGSPNLGGQQQFQNRQFSLADLLQNQIKGNAPSAAQIQLQQGQEQGLRNALALAASQRGNQNQAVVQRNLMNQFAQGQGDLNQKMALLRAQEAQGATGSLVNLLGLGGQQSINAAGLQQQGSIANQQAQLQQQSQNNQLVEYYTSLGYNAQQAQMQALMDLEKLKAGNYNAVLGSNMQGQIANQGQNNQVMGGLLKAISSAGAMGAA